MLKNSIIKTYHKVMSEVEKGIPHYKIARKYGINLPRLRAWVYRHQKPWEVRADDWFKSQKIKT